MSSYGWALTPYGDEYRQSVVDLLQGGKTGEELMHIRYSFGGPAPRFSDDEVREIRALYDTDIHSQSALAEMYHCSAACMWEILNGAGTYAHLPTALRGQHNRRKRILTDEQVLDVWQLHAAGLNPYRISQQLCCDHSVVYRILDGKTYRDVRPDEQVAS